MNFFKTFIFALFSNCACINFIEHREKSSSTAGFVLDIIVDFNSKFIDSRDIYILREHCKEFCDKVEDLHSEITKKIANFIPIVSPSGQETLTQTNIVKASFIIIITDVFSQSLLLKHFSPATKSRYWEKSTKCIFVAVNIPENKLKEVAMFFTSFRHLNVVIVEEIDEKLRVFSINFFNKKKEFYEINTRGSSDVTIYFPDKFRNLFLYHYQIFYVKKSHRLKFSKTSHGGVDVLTMMQIARNQNAGLAINRARSHTNSFHDVNLDFTIDTSIMIPDLDNLSLTSVQLFETDGFCAFIPFPPRKSVFDLLMRPFDTWTWLFIFLSVFCLSATWKVSNFQTLTSSSLLLFIFSIVSSFFGQSVLVHHKNAIQKLLVLLVLFLALIFGNIYQSLIISFISDARNGNKCSTIDEMTTLNLTYQVDPVFNTMFNKSLDYPKLKSRITKALGNPTMQNYEEMSTNNVAVILSCSVVDLIMNELPTSYEYSRKPINFYYKLDERFYSFYLKYVMTYRSPFGETIQNYSFKLFESGLKQHWTTGSIPPYENLKERKNREYYEKEEYFLAMKDLWPVFIIFVIGCLTSCFLFFMELFFNLLTNFRCSREKAKKSRKKELPRVVQVEPINI